jgi:hypothetical protein
LYVAQSKWPIGQGGDFGGGNKYSMSNANSSKTCYEVTCKDEKHKIPVTAPIKLKNPSLNYYTPDSGPETALRRFSNLEKGMG